MINVQRGSNEKLYGSADVFTRFIDRIERVQRRFTKKLRGLSDLPYLRRLELLSIESLELRRIRADLLFLFKMIHGLVDIDISQFFAFSVSTTRGHNFKIDVQYCRLNCRKYFFINRTVPIWNSLPSSVVDADSVAIFRKTLLVVDLSSHCRGRAYTES